MSDIFATNLCGRKIYRKWNKVEKCFGKIVADCDFETEFTDKDSDAGSVLVMCDKPTDGWPARVSPDVIKLLRKKKIRFDENSGFWYVFKTSIEDGKFALDKRMVIDNE